MQIMSIFVDDIFCCTMRSIASSAIFIDDQHAANRCADMCCAVTKIVVSVVIAAQRRSSSVEKPGGNMRYAKRRVGGEGY
jgi:hypothetical protein